MCKDSITFDYSLTLLYSLERRTLNWVVDLNIFNDANCGDIIMMSQNTAPIYSYKNPLIYHQNVKNWNFGVHSNFHSNLNRLSRLYLKSYANSDLYLSSLRKSSLSTSFFNHLFYNEFCSQSHYYFLQTN